ncbi:hypothetical protein FA09DRAFT_1847 [Tilletiopsis washingtonensis]|jgi:hypothetical protein|uniref:Uncharacterized protein n=1 Tax=Tilletiopsis washingtonensis TaxID=58919 RepID=A0A316ZL25_9BASI|nr:hypothetical protein FA09DRAFT_1847 [Tilletiopsis washingtonensis]PWO01096.1 hypothetical protein FA09DRAFT_1847 [Tilletiopsis washingtonensis]
MQRTICVALAAPSLSSCGAQRGRCTVALFAGVACMSLRPERSEEVSLRCRACGIEMGWAQAAAGGDVGGRRACAASSVGCGVLVLPLSPLLRTRSAGRRPKRQGAAAGISGRKARRLHQDGLAAAHSAAAHHAARSTRGAAPRTQQHSYAEQPLVPLAEGCGWTYRQRPLRSEVQMNSAMRGTRHRSGRAALERGVHQEPAVPAQAPSLSWKCCPAQRERARGLLPLQAVGVLSSWR